MLDPERSWIVIQFFFVLFLFHLCGEPLPLILRQLSTVQALTFFVNRLQTTKLLFFFFNIDFCDSFSKLRRFYIVFWLHNLKFELDDTIFLANYSNLINRVTLSDIEVVGLPKVLETYSLSFAESCVMIL